MIDRGQIDNRLSSLQSLSEDFQLLLAAFGLEVNVDQFNPEALWTVSQSGQNYLRDLRTFAEENGLTDLELNSSREISSPRKILADPKVSLETVQATYPVCEGL